MAATEGDAMLRIATWNINSVRLRLPLVLRFLRERRPDVMCLQETKCPNPLFPREAFVEAGYPHVEIHGQKGYHGVATISRMPLRDAGSRDYCAMGDTRHLTATLDRPEGAVRVHNFYVPAGGDEPDRERNPKFDHKLRFIDEMRGLRAGNGGAADVLVGDLNIAPEEADVWSSRQLRNVVSHTPVEREAMRGLIAEGGWRDLMRHHAGPDERLYTWWSYRNRDWRASNRGRRLDHVWGSAELPERVLAMEVLVAARDWEKPSDHVPVIVDLDL